jgi:4'-phosphopantetheinyl transferase
MHVLVHSLPSAVLPTLGPDEVHVWVARLEEQAGAEPDPVLTAGERERAARYRHPQARDQFVLTRILLRLTLARYLATAPPEVEIAVRPDGKPVLAGRHVGFLEFNLSHTDGLALLAVGRTPVGVDVERVRVVESAAGLVERFFSPLEREQYRTLPAELQPGAFLRGWVCKEAVLKGIGCGARELDRCIVDLDLRRPAGIIGPAETRREWSLACWEPAGGFMAAVAVAGVGPLRLEVR